ncbi:MAG: HD domain-containing protein [Acidobacteriaceae bacterium]|nr:HD domain-containing protein [Acidobacteriaceae bacterium]
MAELIGAFSRALDIALGHTDGHTLRSCVLGMKLAECVGLNSAQQRNLYYSLLLKDLGITGDFVRGMRYGGFAGSEPALAWSYGKEVLPKRRILPVLADLLLQRETKLPFRQIVRRVFASQSQTGDFLRNNRMLAFHRTINAGFSRDVADTVAYIDTRWDGRGLPLTRRASVSLQSQLVKMAQTLESLYEVYGANLALDIIYRRCKGWFDPGVIAAAMITFRLPESWEDLERPNLLSYVARLEPEDGDPETAPENIDGICEIFADLIDSFTHNKTRHSHRVMRLALQIGSRMGLPQEKLTTIRRAALMHDLGCMGVECSSGELQRDMAKTQRLALEWLSSVQGFEEVATTVAMHGEYLDGSGAPFGLRGDEIALCARVLAVAEASILISEQSDDVTPPDFDALAHELEETMQGKLDVVCLRALQDVSRIQV